MESRKSQCTCSPVRSTAPGRFGSSLMGWSLNIARENGIAWPYSTCYDVLLSILRAEVQGLEVGMGRRLWAATVAVACTLAGGTAWAADAQKCAKPEEMTAMQT